MTSAFIKKSVLSLFLGCFFLSSHPFRAQGYDPALFNCIKWRMIGPHLGGRTVGAVGVPQEPNVFYIGVNNGGVWKTTDYGRTWKPIFDEQATGSIGDVAVAPTNPNIVYAASGEGIQRPDLSIGDGIYKSTDAGKTWMNMGLQDGQQIGGIAIDPKNENRVFAAVLGHPYGPNTERGVYRTADGGKTWERVLYKDENTGAIQVNFDPSNSNILYASLWAGRQGPWENGAWNGPESGLFKSTDGGSTWKKLEKGLPTASQGLARIGFCIAPSDPSRLYAVVDAPEDGGIYRSDDGGENWKLLSRDKRYWGRGADFAEIKTDPKNPDIVYCANIVVWKSEDGGKTWKGFRGAPGGDDYHRIWINPIHPQIIILASDQGAIITVNGGETFSSWYNQPTAQFYHVSTDNAFPYNVYGGQQESGSVGISSRGNDGQITFREWHPVGAEEYGYVAADPLNSNLIYGGKLSRFDKRTGQSQDIAPEAVRAGKYRFLRTAPVLFSPVDPHVLFYAGNIIFKTRDGGNSWQEISPDLTRESWDIPASIGMYRNEEMKKMPRRGVVYTLAPSPLDSNTLWAGTDDGLIQLTRDGGISWKNVTPPEITSWSKVSILEASHTDPRCAYAAVNRIRLDDMRPHIYRTRDGGASWQEITNGLPKDPINVVREDPARKGLLYAGSERAVYVSFNDGDHWQSLRLNMPATSIRDLVIKDDDLVVGTHGRSFWIADNISPLRQLNKLAAEKSAILFKPQLSYLVRWNMNTDTPIPQEEPSGQNPPDGAMIDYYLQEDATGETILEITDSSGKLVRSFSSKDKPYEIPAVNIPHYWIRPQQILSGKAGAHRFLWDMHYTPLDVPPSYPISAIYGETAPRATSPWIMPGKYTVTLRVNGSTFSQPLFITMDPRIKTSHKELQKQHDLSFLCYENSKQVSLILKKIGNLLKQIKELQPPPTNLALIQSLKQFEEILVVLEKTAAGSQKPSFGKVNSAFISIFEIIEDTDMPVTRQAASAFNEASIQLKDLQQTWERTKTNEWIRINADLAKVGLKTLE